MKPVRSTIALILTLLATCPARADESLVLDLWPGKVPGDVGLGGRPERTRNPPPPHQPTLLVTDVTKPTLSVFLPPKEKNTGTAMIICPGGGYWDLYWVQEGEEVAEWLNSIGVTGIILKYRVPRRPGEDKRVPPPGPLMDAQRAVSLIRSRASDWGIDPNRIGIVGFSAGGHLALATATSCDRRTYEAVDEIDRVSCRPDFSIPVYPGYLKADDKDAIVDSIPIASDTPPVMLVHAGDDSEATVEHSVFMYLALRRAGVPVEMHIFMTGEHGFGARRDDQLPSSWMLLCVKWLKSQGLLGAAG